MAKAVAICKCKTCGEEFEKTAMKRNQQEAESWKTWAVGYFDECTDCWKTKKQEEREREKVEWEQKAKDENWPELTGTPKQVAWANTIRMNAIRKMEQAFEDAEKRDNPVPNETKQKIMQKVKSFTHATWFINNRESEGNYLVEKVLRMTKKEEANT